MKPFLHLEFFALRHDHLLLFGKLLLGFLQSLLLSKKQTVSESTINNIESLLAFLPLKHFVQLWVGIVQRKVPYKPRIDFLKW